MAQPIFNIFVFVYFTRWLSLKHSIVSDHSRPTLSAEYRAFEEVIINAPIAELDSTADIRTIIKYMRSSFTMGTMVPKPFQCQIYKEVFQHDGHSVDAYWINYHQNNFRKSSDKTLLYFHGGGYMLGDIQSKLCLLYMKLNAPRPQKYEKKSFSSIPKRLDWNFLQV